MGAWELTFEGKQAVLKHEQGIYYVAYLLLYPPAEPIHALDLATTATADGLTSNSIPIELKTAN